SLGRRLGIPGDHRVGRNARNPAANREAVGLIDNRVHAIPPPARQSTRSSGAATSRRAPPTDGLPPCKNSRLMLLVTFVTPGPKPTSPLTRRAFLTGKEKR